MLGGLRGLSIESCDVILTQRFVVDIALSI
ncbi:unnamed protein product, partial [Didymodactylos carnosus]